MNKGKATIKQMCAFAEMREASRSINSLETLPEHRQLVYVLAYEFGRTPALVLVRFIQLKDSYSWMLLKEYTGYNRDTYLADEVHGWLSLDQLGEHGRDVMEWEKATLKGKRKQ